LGSTILNSSGRKSQRCAVVPGMIIPKGGSGLTHWGIYVLFLIVAAGAWEIYKECRSGYLVRKTLASYRLPDLSRDVHAEPFMRTTLKMKPWVLWGLCIFLLAPIISSAAFYVVIVLLTGDFSEIPVSPRDSPHILFIAFLLIIVGGTIKQGPFLLIKWMIAALKTRRPFLFFDCYFRMGKKQVYPYEALEVRVGEGIRKYITIIPPLPEKTTWMDHIEIGDDERSMHYTTKEDFTRLEQFLEERVPNFHRIGATDSLSDEDRKKRNMRWVYALMLLSTLCSVFMAWYLLSHQ
jgi:hypothetical protein